MPSVIIVSIISFEKLVLVLEIQYNTIHSTAKLGYNEYLYNEVMLPVK